MFASFLQASAGSDRSPFGSFWFQPIGGYSAAGVNVTPDSAMRVSAVYACVREIAQSYSILPIRFYEQKGLKKVPVNNHPLFKLLTKAPNRYQNAYEWRLMMESHRTLRGTAYNRIIEGRGGKIAELMPIHPDRITPLIRNDGSYAWQVTNRDGSIELLSREEVFVIKGLAPDIYRGYNPIELARDAIGTALAAQNYGARFFANDAKPSGGWIEHPGTFKDKDAKKAFRDTWQEMQSGNNRGKTAVLEGGMKYHTVEIKNTDAQFLETKKYTVEDIARLFGVPPHRIGHLERSTNNNIEHQGLEFVTYTMMPAAESWESALVAQLMFDDDETQIDHDFTRLLRGDSKSRAAYYRNGILDGWMVRNEARIAEGLDPIDGLDEPLRPLNMVPESEAEEENAEEETKETNDDNELTKPPKNED